MKIKRDPYFEKKQAHRYLYIDCNGARIVRSNWQGGEAARVKINKMQNVERGRSVNGGSEGKRSETNDYCQNETSTKRNGTGSVEKQQIAMNEMKNVRKWCL